MQDASFYAAELGKLDLLKVGGRKVRVDPDQEKDKIETKQEALAAIIILAKNCGPNVLKSKLKSVKEAYVQKV